MLPTLAAARALRIRTARVVIIRPAEAVAEIKRAAHDRDREKRRVVLRPRRHQAVERRP